MVADASVAEKLVQIMPPAHEATAPLLTLLIDRHPKSRDV